MSADELIRPWYEHLAADVPGLTVFDAHTHTGQNDPDGFRSTPEQLLSALARVDARAAVFTMNEPGGYPPANDRVLAEATASEGRLVPFCRLDPRRDAAGEAERCLDAGAAGIKLHPRAEAFSLMDPGVREVFSVAAERRVPVLIHAGRGIPALGRHALATAEDFPSVPIILAHAGISDLAWIWRDAPSRPNLYFDTAWWNVSDLLTLFALIPPGKILFASDAPYGSPLSAAVMALRCGLQVGLEAPALAGIMGAQMDRLLSGAEPLDLGPAPGLGRTRGDLLLERVNQFLTWGLSRTALGLDPAEGVALARLACEVGEDAPEAPVCRSVLALLDRAEREGSRAEEPEQPFWPGTHLLAVAGTVARTADVPLPANVEHMPVGERSP